VAIGYRDVKEWDEEIQRIYDELGRGAALSEIDTARALASVEIAFASDVFGSGPDWPITTGFADEETIRILRKLQERLAGTYRIDEGRITAD
jgi:hypothetical protein